jgi:hypothetical protein
MACRGQEIGTASPAKNVRNKTLDSKAYTVEFEKRLIRILESEVSDDFTYVLGGVARRPPYQGEVDAVLNRIYRGKEIV